MGKTQDAVMLAAHLLEGLACRYAVARPFYGALSRVYGAPRPFMRFGEDLFLARVKRGNRLLDLGCGPGVLGGMLGDRFSLCVGLDLSMDMLARAGRFSPACSLVCGNMARLPFPDQSFDQVTSLGAVHCVDPDALAAEAARVVTPGGEVHILIDDTVIPRIVPRASGHVLARAFQQQGFSLGERLTVGRFYLYLRFLAPLRDAS
ncbi:MAG: class I SAM-dependent methyltransferase [Proteobacteria bacterium]|nr:class I SAM-dependent methyltransferase [Pseudomonadota bacterium]